MTSVPPPSAMFSGTGAREVTEDDLAANVVLAIHRLTKSATLYDGENQAVVRQLESSRAAIHEYGHRTRINPKIFFTDKSVFVGGRLLRAGRSVYGAALELGAVLRKHGIDEMAIAHDVSVDDLRRFQAAIRDAQQGSGASPAKVDYERIRLRRGQPPGRRKENLPPEELIIRTYATATIVMRRFLEALQQGDYRLPIGVRRVAQQLAELSSGQSSAFLGTTAIYNAKHEHAGRAVNSALVALAMARQLSDDKRMLARVATAALMFDVGVARVAGVVSADDVRAGRMLPRLIEDQLEELPASGAATMWAIGGFGDTALQNTVLVYEALSMAFRQHVPVPYDGLHQPSLGARIVATSRQFNELLSHPDSPRNADEAVSELVRAAQDELDRMLVRLLASALSLFTTGSIVHLSNGEVAKVVRTHDNPLLFAMPVVQEVLSSGKPAKPIDLSLEEGPNARRVTALVELGSGGLRSRESDEPEAVEIREVDDLDDDDSAADESWGDLELAEDSVPSPRIDVMPVEHDRAARPSPGPATPPFGHSRPAPSMPVVAARARPVEAATERAAAARAPQRGERTGAVDDALRAYLSEMESDARSKQRGPSSPPPVSLPPLTPPPLTPPPMAVRRARGAGRSDHAPLTPAPFTPAPRTPLPSGPLTPAPFRGAEKPRALANAGAGTPAPSARELGVAALEGLQPTATGSLSKTPLVHLLVYVLDRRMTGTTALVEPDGQIHLIYFDRGVASKVRTSGTVHPLDKVLRDLGAVDARALQRSVLEVEQSGMLHGQHLLAQGLIDRATLLAALQWQLSRKMSHLLSLTEACTFAYFDGVDGLVDYGGPELTPVDPMALIMAGLRIMGKSPLVSAALAKLGSQPLVTRGSANFERLRLHADEMAVVDALRARPAPLSELVAERPGKERVALLTVYALVITRNLEAGLMQKPPVGHDVAPIDDLWLHIAPLSDPRITPPPTTAPHGGKWLSSPRPPASEPARGSEPALGSDPAPATPAPASGPSFEEARKKEPTGRALQTRSPLVLELDAPEEEATPTPSPVAAAPSLALGGGPPRDKAAKTAPSKATKPIDPYRLFKRAQLKLMSGKLDEAEDLVQQAVDAAPSEPEYRATLAWIQAEILGPPEDLAEGETSEHYGAQIALLDEACASDASFAKAFFYRAELLRRTGQLERALADYERVVALDPHNEEAAAHAAALR